VAGRGLPGPGVRGGAARALPRRRAACARRTADPSHARSRTLLRRWRRHAAPAACALREPRQPRVGARASEEVLPELQLRAAGGRDGGGRAALARSDAQLPARGRVPLPESGDRPRDADPGDAGFADLRDALAVELDDLTGGSP